MLGFKVLVNGKYNYEQLHVEYQDRQVEYSSEALDAIEKVWLEKESSGIKLFDGKLFRVVAYKSCDQELFLKLENTSYKQFVGSRSKEFLAKFGIEITANPLSVGGVVLSTDNCFIIGKRRNDLFFNPGKYSIIAGTVDREKDWANGKPDPFRAILRELSEEKGVQSNDVREVYCLGLIYNIDYSQTYMPFKIDLKLSSEDIIQKTPTEHEFAKFMAVQATREGTKEFLVENHQRISQTCFANLLLWGQQEFGNDWLGRILKACSEDSGISFKLGG